MYWNTYIEKKEQKDSGFAAAAHEKQMERGEREMDI